MELYAHYDKENDKNQSLDVHCRNVGQACSSACKTIGLEALGRLAGLLHDAGKATKCFQQYLREQNPAFRGSINHSACGARYLAERYGMQTTVAGLTATLAAAAVCGHHSGLPDCTSLSGENLLNSRVFPERETFYAEAASNFTRECISDQELAGLFQKAQGEVYSLHQRVVQLGSCLPPGRRKSQQDFFWGLTARFLHSSLIDADRYDAYLFEAGLEEGAEPDRAALWKRLSGRIETHLGSLNKEKPMDSIRARISDACAQFADHGPGVYQLYVPTGGGKTLSSVRFSLRTAVLHPDIRRIFYVAPFKTILEQNAGTIREILREDAALLEHHSDVIPDSHQKERDGECQELDSYELLTQRWNSPLIFTTMVQFLNTLFSRKSSCARRFHSLANSVILLDEVQSVPVRFVSMLNAALNYLAGLCGCTVILCTATQPELGSVPVPVLLSPHAQMVPEELTSFAGFHRTSLVDKTNEPALSAGEFAEFLLCRQRETPSVLAVLNTKTAARRVYSETAARSPVPVYYLSTSLCPQHRISLIGEITAQLRSGRPLICVSTQLIEAGVDLSFGCVVRSFAGLASIAQAAGRCNRHGEAPCSPVYIVKSADENLSGLRDIVLEQDAVKPVLESFRKSPAQFGNSLLSPAAVRAYYQRYYHDREQELDYIVTAKDDPGLFAETSLYSLLSSNETAWSERHQRGAGPPEKLLNQMFQTAGALVKVIDQDGIDVLVPYREGKEIIHALEQNPPLSEIPQLLRRAQRFTVHLYRQTAQTLSSMGALHSLGETGAAALDELFYDEKLGVQTQRREMPGLLY